MLQRVIKPLRELFRHEQWNIGIVHAPIHAFLRGGGDLPPVRWFPRAPRGQFLADPFGFQQNGSLYVFYEHFDYSRFNGWLVALKTDRDFAKWESHDVMPQSVHASYPFLLEHAGQLYCIPETQKAGEVKLYRSERLPDKWEFVATLIRGFPAVDPTIVRHDGRWWLFAVSGEQGADDQLHIWHAAELLGPWQAHKKNPVKIDKSSARPGGTPFVHEEQLYRPAQDCTRTYGGRTVIMRVTELSKDEFAEEQAAVVAPQPDWPFADGLHTISAVGDDLTLIDAKRYLFTFGGFRQKLSSIMRKAFSR